MRFQMGRWVLGLCCLLGGWRAFGVSTAQACGGFFCDRPSVVTGPPIAQAAENVVFALNRDPVTGVATVEAHIQIVYAGAADQFSWIVPMTSEPTLSTGSDVLFQILEPKTRPTFTTQFTTEGTCKNSGGASIGCGGGSTNATSGGPKGYFDAGVAPVPTVDVSFHGNVGPFDAAVIRSDNAAALEDWLAEHKYFVTPEASKIIQTYVAKGTFFVALRLQSGHDVNEIQPIVVKLASEEGCLPLMLTAIAATPDVRINVWVLGNGRAVPLNYDEIVLNLAKLDWLSGGANYDRIVSEAANEAGGNAFLAEYAQPTATAATWFAVPPDAVARLASSSSPGAFVAVLQSLGLPLSGRVLEVLRAQIPEPASLINQGFNEAQFYGSLSSPTLATVTFKTSAPAAAAQIDSDVLQPMRTLQALFAKHAYLTRLATFISPDEMTKDPLFVTNRLLPPLSNLHTATAYVQCGDEDFEYCLAPIRLQLEDGRAIRFAALSGGACGQGATTAFDRGRLDIDLPAALQSWRRDADGEGTKMLDNTSAVTTAINAHNWGIPSPGGSDCAVGARGGRRSWFAGLTLIAALIVARARRRR